MAHWLNLGQNLRVNAKRFPRTIALKDRDRAFTYPETNRRVNRLAHSLLALGLQKGDKVAVLLENCIEIVELYLATAKIGLVIVPIDFLRQGPDIEYIVNHSEARALIVHDEFAPTVDAIRGELSNIAPGHYVVVGGPREGYREYEGLLRESPEGEPAADVRPEDTWILVYTSGTTGKPKGVVRSHESHVAFYLINAIDFGFNEHDVCLNVIPLHHINSTFFTFTFTYIGATAYIHPARSFRADEVFEIIEREKITFISLVPTHYHRLLNAPAAAQARDVRSLRKLLCSSAPVRREMKLAIMEVFPGVELYEAYGSTEAGIVTVLKPEHQMEKLGSIGCESLGTDFVRILDEEGNEVPVGQVGELYSRGPMLFDGYYKKPELTAGAFQGEWFTARDMAYRDEDGYFYIKDRKDDMIITGAYKVYPSDVEAVIRTHPGVQDVAVIGIPHEEWGEAVHAVVVPRGPENPPTTEEIIEYTRGQVTSYERPKSVEFIRDDQMPRTAAASKVQRRQLREQRTRRP